MKLNSEHQCHEVPWLSKEEAARQLGTTVRTVERYVAERKLGCRPLRMPGRKPLPTIDPEDVARMASEMNKGAVLPPQLLESKAGAQIDVLRMIPDLVNRIAESIELSRPPRVRQFMTIEEAAQYTSLPLGLLRRFVRQGRLPAETWRPPRSGPGDRQPSVTWVKTADLDALAFTRADNSDNGRDTSESADHVVMKSRAAS
jgi:hypothetical protein